MINPRMPIRFCVAQGTVILIEKGALWCSGSYLTNLGAKFAGRKFFANLAHVLARAE
jgi:hypothetical protein